MGYVLGHNHADVTVGQQGLNQRLQLDGGHGSRHADQQVEFVAREQLCLHSQRISLLFLIIIDPRATVPMIHTFSPNWYRPQCLLFTPKHLIYASNYTLYKYNLVTRRIEGDKCFRKLAMQQSLNSKDIKIHSIVRLNQEQLLVGLNQAEMVVLDEETLGLAAVWKAPAPVASCWGGHGWLAVAPEGGGLGRVAADGGWRGLGELKEGEKVREVVGFQGLWLVVYSRGQLVIMDGSFEAVIATISAEQLGLKNETILSVDSSKNEGSLQIGALTRTKQGYNYIHIWQAHAVLQSQNKYNFKQILKTEIKTHYPKGMTEKIKAAQKAALCIKFISQSHLVLSGKLGELYILNLPHCPEQLVIKPHALDQIPECLQILQDPKHYKQIYGMYLHPHPKTKQPELYTISTDQTLNVWQVSGNTLKHIYSVKFVTAELMSIFASEADPNTSFFLLKDSIIRSAAPLSAMSNYLAEYWRHTKKFKILKAVGHLSEPGICAMATDCGKVLVYQLFQDRLMKVIDVKGTSCEGEIVNITFEYVSILKPIEQIINAVEGGQGHAWVAEQMKINRLYSREIQNEEKIGLLIQQRSKMWYIYRKDPQHEDSISIKRSHRLQRVHNTKLWDEKSLLVSNYKGNALSAWLHYHGQILHVSAELLLSGRCIFKMDYPHLRVLEFKGKRANLYTFNTEDNLKLVRVLQVELPILGEQAVLDYHSCQALFYNKKDDMLAHLKFNTESFLLYCYETGNKIENLSFVGSDHVLAGFKDQSIKLLKLVDLPSVKDNPHKKVKKNVHQDMEQEVQEQKPSASSMMDIDQ